MKSTGPLYLVSPLLLLLSSCYEEPAHLSTETLSFTVEGEKHLVPKDCVAPRWPGDRLGTDSDGDPIYTKSLFRFVLPDYKCEPLGPPSKRQWAKLLRDGIRVLEYRPGNGKTPREVFDAFKKTALAPTAYRISDKQVDEAGNTTMVIIRGGAAGPREERHTIEMLHDEAFLTCQYPEGSCQITRVLPNKLLVTSFMAHHRARAREIDEGVTNRVASFIRD